MDETESRLRRCFSAVFPSFSSEEILKADATKLEAWDSVASVTLFAIIEEEFGIEMDIEDGAKLLSFAGIVDYLQLRKASPAPGNAPS
jgi:acyl carrier protein